MPKKREETAVEVVKTSLRIPRHLWREARIRAMDDGSDLQTVVAQALAEYLGVPVGGRRGEGRRGGKR